MNKTPDLARVVRTAREVNDGKPQWVINKVQEAVEAVVAKTGKPTNDVKVVCYGLAFKPNIDDLRESPALMITNKLAALYPNQVLAVEPNIADDHFETKQSFELISYDTSKEIADVAVILVDHNEFKSGLSFKNDAVIVDTKGIC